MVWVFRPPSHSDALAQWRAGLYKPTKTSALSSLQTPADAGGERRGYHVNDYTRLKVKVRKDTRLNTVPPKFMSTQNVRM